MHKCCYHTSDDFTLYMSKNHWYIFYDCWNRCLFCRSSVMELWVHWPQSSTTLQETAYSAELAVWLGTWLRNVVLLNYCIMKGLQPPLLQFWYQILVVQLVHDRWQWELWGLFSMGL